MDFPIPANDDASKSIALIIKKMIEAIEEGSSERKLDRDKREEEGGEEGEEHAASKFADDDDDDAREIARKKRVAAGLEPADGDDRKRPRKPVARKPAPGAARKPRP